MSSTSSHTSFSVSKLLLMILSLLLLVDVCPFLPAQWFQRAGPKGVDRVSTGPGSEVKKEEWQRIFAGEGRQGSIVGDVNFLKFQKALTEAPPEGKAREFLLEQYKNAVEEIRARIHDDMQIFLIKFSLIGGVLFIMFQMHGSNSDTALRALTRSPMAAALCWTAAIVAAMVDVRRQFNVDIIVALGYWVSKMETLVLGDKAVLGWEHFVGVAAPWSSPAYPLLRLSNELITFSLWGMALWIFLPIKGNRANLALVHVARMCGTVFILVLVLHALHFHDQHRWFPFACGAVGALMLLVFHGYLFRLHRRFAKEEDVEAETTAPASLPSA